MSLVYRQANMGGDVTGRYRESHDGEWARRTPDAGSSIEEGRVACGLVGVWPTRVERRAA